jgi:hypothetical protein
MMLALNEFDLAFVVDTTGSMGPLISAARQQMVGMIDALSRASVVDMRLGVVEYRDHPPLDTVIYREHAFTSDLAEAKATISKLKPKGGGGDGPEAVYAGLVAAQRTLSWRTHARRVAVLVGDAPPHGVGARGDAFPYGCPSGETVHSTSAKLEKASIRLYAIGLAPAVAPSFSLMSTLTGGSYFESHAGGEAIQQIAELLKSEFGQLEFDQQVFERWTTRRAPEIEAIAAELTVSPGKVAAAVSRLACRDLLEV